MEPSVADAPPSRRHLRCEPCATWVLPKRPHWGWLAAERATWVAIPSLLFLASKGPGLVLLPVVCVMGAGLFGPLREKAHATPRCPACTRYVA